MSLSQADENQQIARIAVGSKMAFGLTKQFQVIDLAIHNYRRK